MRTWGTRRLPSPPKFYVTEEYHSGSGSGSGEMRTWGTRRLPSPPKFYVTEEYHSGSGEMSTWGTRRLPSPPKFYVTEEYHSGSGDLSDGFGRLSISPCTTRYSRSHSTFQRSDVQLFQQWMSSDTDSKTVLRQLGYGSGGDDAVQRPPPPQRKPSSLPASESNVKGDAPRVDLHIHINNNNIGNLSFGPPNDAKGSSKKYVDN